MKLSILFTIALLALPAASRGSEAPAHSPAKPAQQTSPTAKSNTTQQHDDGDALFATHCARCHMPPMTLSQRTTGTVIMHMRVRARLSAQDEKQLLKYLAP